MDVRQEMTRIVKGVIEELIHQGIQILTLNSSESTGEVSGRFRAGQLVYDYRIKGGSVTYGPIGASASQGRADGLADRPLAVGAFQ